MLSRSCKIAFVLLCAVSFAGYYHFPRILLIYEEYFPPQNASLCGCDSCIQEADPWLTPLMAPSPKPFLSTQNNISAGTFKYWRRFQLDRRSFGNYAQMVDKVLRMFPNMPQVAQPGPDRCISCAVVGNSANLNGSHYGPLIDIHDFVIRMNRAPTKGFEHDVGSRTTHHIMYPNSAVNLQNQTHLVLFPYKTADLEWLVKNFTPPEPGDRNEKPRALEANKDLVMVLSPAFMEYVHKYWLRRGGNYPSTGFMTLILSLHMCDEVGVFGFGADKNGYWGHYFEEVHLRKTAKTGQHPGSSEYKQILKLQAQRKIQFYRGW